MRNKAHLKRNYGLVSVRLFSMRLFSCFVGAFLTLWLSVAAQAQNRSAILSRLDRLEERMLELQSSHPASAGAASSAPLPRDATARIEVSLSEVQEDMRQLRGLIEEQSYQIRRVSELQSQLQREYDLRIEALEKQLANAAQVPATASNAMDAPVIDDAPSESTAPKAAQSEGTSSPAGSPSEIYQNAFDLLNEGSYSEAVALFEAFIAQHGNHQLIGNAHYWLGEALYVQNQFQSAANQFRLGFQAMPDGPKAPDNLLRLGMTLGVLEQKKEACIILNQLLSKHTNGSQTIKRKATNEREQLQCQ